MKGDFTRSTFDPGKRYSSVRMQQGRVQLDADWNEQLDITARRMQVEALDVIGPTGAPQGSDAFKASLTPDGADLAIAPGRIYVDGILCELAPDETLITHVTGNKVTLDAVTLDGRALAKDDWVEIELGNAQHRRQIDTVSVTKRVVTLAGGALVGGARGRLRRLTTYTTQRDLPGQRLPTAGAHAIVLDVWERHVTAHEDPDLREVALGGPDTTTRTQVLAQMKLLPLAGVSGAPGCGDVPELSTLLPQRTGRLRARAHPEEAESSPCLAPASAGYRRLENQLYRVEIHRVRSDGSVTFKWSRDNGSVVTGWSGREGDDLLVASLGRDGVLGFRGPTWAELIDESHELRGDPGILVRVTPSGVADNTLKVEQVQAGSSLPDYADFPLHPKVRRWDSEGEIEVRIASDNEGFLRLEGGVEVRFEMDGAYQPGDYWLIPARAAIGDEGGDVLWPRDLADPNHPRPAARLPDGVAHHACLLGVWRVGAAPVDCRAEFPPLTGLTTLLVESGDGQEALPGHALPHALQVRVVNGQAPVIGARVRFAVLSGGGALADSDVVTVAPNGIAETTWTLGAAASGPQRVRAALLDAHENAVPGQVLHFNANLSLAGAVAYQPVGCDALDMAQVSTVQEALDVLCQRPSGAGCALVAAPGAGWQQVFDRIGDNQDAHICLPVGDYPVAQTVVVANKGRITLSGGGPGTRILADKLESALLFRDCVSVRVHDVYVRSGRSGRATAHLNGALAFENCGAVAAERVAAACAAGSFQGAACISVKNSVAFATQSAGQGSVRVRDCTLAVGHLQIGLLLVNAAGALVDGNTIAVAERPPTLTLQRMLQDKRYRAAVRKIVVADAALVRPARAPARSAPRLNAEVAYGGYTVQFNTDPALGMVWQALVDAQPPKQGTIRSERDLLAHVETLADAVLLSEGRYGDLAAARDWYRRLVEEQPSVASQGIVVAGAVAPDVRVMDNRVQGVLQGIRVGVSHREPRAGAPDVAGRVQIAGNTIGLLLPPIEIRERYGIFVGNCNSLRVEDNAIVVSKSRLTEGLHVEGVRVYGHLGRMALVQANHMAGVTVGVRVTPLNPTTTQQHQWLVSTNMAEQAQAAVVADRRVRQRDNFA